ncbi:MAG: type II toxin-antitoxin system PemK/MazF family toxin, partial [Saprospiraceae bacterium]|nr:type II toxin-antitoxin system PemK/MazF family toxin [Saprospiraceae bacterium]
RGSSRRPRLRLLDLNPQLGTEMAKRRPCLVLSKKSLNQKTKRILICPISSTPPVSILHVSLPANQKNITGTIVVDQIKTLDFRARHAQKIDTLNDRDLYNQVVHLIQTIIEL